MLRVRYQLIRRLISYMVDFTLISVVTTLIMAVLRFVLPRDLFQNGWVFGGIFIGLLGLLYFIYESHFLTRNQRTIGRRITGLDVIFQNDSTIALRTVIKILSIFLIVPAVFSAGLINWGDETSSLHDKMAHSQVIYKDGQL